MAASYPSSVKSFTPLVDNTDYPQATQVTQIYDEITALEQALLSTGLLLGNGSLSNPAVGFVSDPNTGLYRVGADNLALVTGGVAALDIDAVQQINSATQFRCRVDKSGAQSIADATVTAVTFGAATEAFDVGAMHDESSNTSRITVPTGGDGIYLFGGGGQFAANATGIRLLYFRKNGSDINGINAGSPGSASGVQAVGTAGMVSMAAGDYLELTVFQTSGGALNFSASAFWAVKLW